LKTRSALAALTISIAPAAAAAQTPPAPPAEAPAASVEAQAGPTETPAAPAAAKDEKKPAPPPYSLPWQLRPAMPVNAVRSDTSIAFYKDPKTDEGGATLASFLLASYKVTPNFSPLVRVGWVWNSPPKGDSGTGPVNVALGATFGAKLTDDIRLGMFLGVALPVGIGGGNEAAAENAVAARSGIAARSAMDNAMFAVNDFVLLPGLDIAYINHGLTVQWEATVLALARARGEEKQKDEVKINFTTGLHVGYFVQKWLSLGTEFRYQRWLSDPGVVVANVTARDTATIAIGPRFHFKLGKTLWARPGVSYAIYLDDPFRKQKYGAVQIDLPFPF